MLLSARVTRTESGLTASNLDDANRVDPNGWTLLHNSCFEGNLQVCTSTPIVLAYATIFNLQLSLI
jgi:hypothetical protein